jgi:formylmethanofuran dehydrogenase subunit C
VTREASRRQGAHAGTGGRQGWRLRWRGDAATVHGRIDASPLRPDLLGSRSRREIEATRLAVAGRTVALGELFDVQPLSAPGHLVVPGSPRFFRLGCELVDGLLEVEGEAGDHAGEGLRGGLLEVHGDAGSRLGAGMSGGRIIVRGSCGDRAGGPPPGREQGMRGGEILIFGAAGAETGLRLRRGLLAVAGAAGPYPGYALVAGTIVVGRGLPALPGLHMRRGTLVFLEGGLPASTAHPGPHCAREGSFEPLVLRLVLARLRALGFPHAAEAASSGYTRFSVERRPGLRPNALGRGEIWVRRAAL